MRSTDSEVHTELLDLAGVPLGELRTLHTPSLNTAIRKVFDYSKRVNVDEIQVQASF